MGTLTSISDDFHPIDLVENLAEYHDWDFDRVAVDQIAMAVEGQWRTYSLTLAWSEQDERLKLICAFDMEPPQDRLLALYQTMTSAGDTAWSGAFNLWPDQKLMVYRYGLNLAGGAEATPEQIADMMQVAIDMCERYYPAFQLVAWGDATPEEAIKVAIGETWGRA
mgnify:CR=1 FL=1